MDEDELIKNEVEGIPNGFNIYLAVCERIPGKDSDLQRLVSHISSCPILAKIVSDCGRILLLSTGHQLPAIWPDKPFSHSIVLRTW